MKTIPRMARGRRNRFFQAEGVDELMSMVLELTAEVSTLRERQYVMERVLEQHDLPVGPAIESWQPGPDDETQMAEERARLLSTVLRTLEVQPKDADPTEESESETTGRTQAA